MEENEAYNKIIKQQYKDYLRLNHIIERRANKLLTRCNVHYIFTSSQDEYKRKIKQLGGARNLIDIGGGGLIFRAKKQIYENGIDITNLLIQRNLRINLYGALLYELANYEYCLGWTSIKEVLNNMGIKFKIEDDETLILDKSYNVDPVLFDYTVKYYLAHTDAY